MKSPVLSICMACEGAYFPARLRCHRCGGWDFRLVPAPEGVVAASTQVHRVPEGCRHRWLVEVRTSTGVVVLAVGDGPFRENQPVRLAQREDGAVIALHLRQDRS
ncbi:MAG: hypothetical protein JSR41_00275 [Proteobacteria bacterium]|nr:hypothetical protein [Pseudomonadota bacterium]